MASDGRMAAPRPATSTSTSTWGAPTHDPTAVLGRRYAAFFIDAVICTIVFLLLFFAFATGRTRTETLRLPGCHFERTDSSRVQCDNRAVLQINDTVYEANGGPFFGLAFGGSLGKRITGTRVVTEAGTNIGVLRSIVRWLLFAVDGPLSLFLCGIITSAVSRGHRRLGDLAANTYVVAREDAGRPVVIP
jgi:uncharacterized RDD family membrane protein YckC